MSKPLSADLRERVVAAVDSGMSRRKAAERFGGSISSAIRWTAQRRRTGDVRPRRIGGDKRSGRIEAYAPVILAAVEEKPDITLAELRELLAGHGVGVAISTLWRFFARRKITLKKGLGMRNRIVQTYSAAAGSGSTVSSSSTRKKRSLAPPAISCKTCNYW
jgi:transposase